MPYGIDKSIGGDSPENTKWMEECVRKVMKTGKDKSSAIAICKATLKRSKADHAKASYIIDKNLIKLLGIE
jgi:hypothetical protein